MAVYFSLGAVQPFAEMQTEPFEEGVTIVRGDGRIVGLRLEDARLVTRLPEIADGLGLDVDVLWAKLRADNDILINRRAATWGGGGA